MVAASHQNAPVTRAESENGVYECRSDVNGEREDEVRADLAICITPKSPFLALSPRRKLRSIAPTSLLLAGLRCPNSPNILLARSLIHKQHWS